MPDGTSRLPTTKCPNCGGTLINYPRKNKFVCSKCGAKFSYYFLAGF